MNVLVTGSQGFIGSYLCNELLNAGYGVMGIDNFSKYGDVTRAHDSHPNFYLVRHDLKGPMPPGLMDIDYIVAGAAMIGGISYFHKYAYDLLATNERILASTFDTAIELFKKDRLKKIVVLSSSMVFESSEKFPFCESDLSAIPAPHSTYGFQKLAAEYFCKGAYEQHGLPYTIVRPFNCVGVGEDESIQEEKIMIGNNKMLMSHVLPDLVYRALHLQPTDDFPILGSGEQLRQYTNGKDIARGIRLAMECSYKNEDFNISNARVTSVKELAMLVWYMVHGDAPNIVSLPPFEYDVQKRIASVEKAKRMLGFEAEISLTDSIKEVIDYMRKHYGK